MRAVDIIEAKRDGGELSEEQIRFFVKGFTEGDIPDYQASAWAMAVLFQGMTPVETALLTQAIAESGDQIDLSGVVDIVVDKHSTGGVGDKTTLVVEPIVSASGVPVGKMSGRGLSFTGGTLDKMESIPGFKVDLTTEEFVDQLERIGLVLSGQTEDLAPADGKLYALRDVTGTVPSIPLIASSVMGKKIAGGAQAIVLDVKVGLGAFMADLDQARRLATLMVQIGNHAKRETIALISDMNQPLGVAVGNSNEVREAVETLRGGGPDDFREHAVEVAANMLLLGKRENSLQRCREMARAALEEGRALEKFRQLVAAQGGDPRILEDLSLLPSAQVVESVTAAEDGWVEQIHAREVGLTVMELGGGRATKGQQIDHGVGVDVLVKVGDQVRRGDRLYLVRANSASAAETAARRLQGATRISKTEVDRLPLFYDRVPEE